MIMKIRFLIIIFTFLILLTQCIHRTKRLYLILENANGVNESTDVLMENESVAKISKLTLFKNKVIIEMVVKKNIEIGNNYDFNVKSDILGTRKILIEKHASFRYYNDMDTVENEYYAVKLEDIINENR